MWSAAAPASTGWAGDEKTVLEDEDYRFRLRLPGDDWRMLSEPETHRFNARAVAGARKRVPSNVHGIVIVQRVSRKVFESVESTITNILPLEDLQVVEREEMKIQDIAARRILLRGRIRGLDCRYQFVFLYRQGYAFQLMTSVVGDPSKEEGADFQAFVDAIEFTPGPIRAREFVPVMPDVLGPSWKVEGGCYSSVVSGLHVTPPKGWRLLAGDALASRIGGAEVALFAMTDPDVRVILTPDLVAGASHEEQEKRYASKIVLPRAGPDAPSLQVSMAGQKVPLRAYGGREDDPVELLHGVYWDDGVAIQIHITFAPADRTVARKKMLSAIAGVEKLSEAARAALHDELFKTRNEEALAGEHFALRGGRYMDFQTGLVWTAPPGIVWLRAGQEARRIAQSAALVFEAPTKGVIGVIRHDRGVEIDAAAYHAVASKKIWGAKGMEQALGRTQVRRVADRPPLRTTHGEQLQDGQRLTYLLATGLKGTTGTRMIAWGYPGNMAKAEQWLAEAVKTLHLAGAPENATSRLPDLWIDRRLGFESRRPGPDWRLSDKTPTVGRKAIPLTILHWSTPTEILTVMAMCNMGHPEHTNRIVKEWVRKSTAWLRGKPTREPLSLQGREGEYLSWPDQGRTWYVTRHRLMYMILHKWNSGTQPMLSPEAALSCFKLLK